MRIAICSSPAYLDMTILLANQLSANHDIFLVIEFHHDPNVSVWETENFAMHQVLTTNYDDIKKFLGRELLEIIDPRVTIALLNLPSMRVASPARWHAILHLVKYLKRINAEVVDIHNLHAVFVMPWLRRMAKVLTLHDPVQHTGEASWGAELHKDIGLRCADRVIVHDRQSVQLLNQRGHADDVKVSTVPLGVYTIYQHWMNPAVKEEGNTILFFGRISPYKGLEYLLRAEPLIAREVPDTKFFIAGQGDFSSYRKLIKEPARYEIHNHYISNRAAAELFQRASCVVLPYTQATQSGVLMTAYAFKKPVVVTDVGGLPETVENGITGFVVPPKDENALASAMIMLLKSKDLREKMKKNIEGKVDGEFSWKRIAREILDVYKNAILKA